ncbi:MAG TPA: M20/M25/M40 family metallo-hydrolase [Bacteroidia bacterium]|jgi:hypothetical protein|nr:M20/M25/M40 family metallo-hydrolase [Bacteroidia bacterium]
MKKYLLPAFIVVFFCIVSFRDDGNLYKVETTDNDSTVISKIYKEACVNGQAYDVLNGLCTKAPKRLSGSPGAQVAVDYMKSVMLNYGFDKVWLVPCMVPHWVRGDHERGFIISPKTKTPIEVNVAALGGSLATPKDGLKGDVVEVSSFEDLDKLGKKGVEGKIVFFNHHWDDSKVSTFEAYGDAVQFRFQGPPAAEKYGAIGAIVRSCTSSIDTFPHTGTTRNDSLAPKIPCCAIATKDANTLHDMIAAQTGIQFSLTMNCQWLPDEKSYNVVGEITGSESPKDIICAGGHLDAWELGDGANDDGAGVAQSVEAIRIFKALGIKPKHSIRCIAFMNEENGGRGGKAYCDSAKAHGEKHIAALESDAGGFTPRGFGLVMNADQKKKIVSWAPLFFQYGVYDFTHEGGGSDIGPLKDCGTPLLGLEPDGARYFDYHHTEIDVMKNVNRRELHLGAASMAAMMYLIDKYGL